MIDKCIFFSSSAITADKPMMKLAYSSTYTHISVFFQHENVMVCIWVPDITKSTENVKKTDLKTLKQR